MYKAPFHNKLIVILIIVALLSVFFNAFPFEEIVLPLILITVVIVFGKQYKSITEIRDKLYIDLYKKELKKAKIISSLSKNNDTDIKNELNKQLEEIKEKTLSITQKIAIIDKIKYENNKNT